MVSTDAGMQIDRSGSQDEKADSPRVETRQPGAKLTDSTERQNAKQPGGMVSMLCGMVTSPELPKYRTRTFSPKSTRKSPETRRNRFPGSTAIFLIPDPAIARPVNSRRPAGRQIESSDKQPVKQSPSIVSTDEGMQIDRSDRHHEKAASASIESLEPASNERTDRLSQPRKQHFGITSTDEGMQIDRSDSQGEKADSPRVETRQPGAKLTDRTERQNAKEPGPIVSVLCGMVTSPKFPKYRTRTVSLKSTRKSPETRKNRFPGSTVTSVIPDSQIARPVNFRRLTGRQIESSDKQPASAAFPIFKT
jgi:hypothetical protein